MQVPLAVLSPSLAIVSALGVFGWLHIQMNTLVACTPILVLGIGVDDAFLLLNTWHSLLAKMTVFRQGLLV